MNTPPCYAVDWSARALADVDAIEAFVAGDAPRAASRIRLKIIAAGDDLSLLPERGPVLRGATRKLTISGRYILRYRITGSTVNILRVRDGRRR